MRYSILAVLVILAADSTARAQTVTAGQWRDRGYFAVSGNYQATSSSFTDSLTSPQFVETETVTSSSKVDTAPGFDITGGVRIWRNMAVGVAVTRFTKTELGYRQRVDTPSLLLQRAAPGQWRCRRGAT